MSRAARCFGARRKIVRGSSISTVSLILLALLLPLALGVSLELIRRIFSPDVWDIGPASRAIAVRNLLSGKPLYPDFSRPPYHDVNAYNPLCYYAAAALTRLFHPNPMSSLEAGRLLVVSCTIAASLFIALNARRAGARADAAIVVALAFILSPFLQPWGFEFHVDMPALACELVGLYAFQARALYGAVVCFELAFFAKQGYAAGIAATIVYSWLTSRRATAFRLAVIYISLCAAIVVVLKIHYPFYLLDTVHSLTPVYDPPAAAFFFGELIGHHLFIFVLALIHVLRRGFKQSVLPLFWVFCICHDSVTAARWGSNFYYFLPSLAASAMLAALELSLWLERWSRRPIGFQAVAAVLMAAFITAQFWSLRHGARPLLEAVGAEGADRSLGCGDSKFAFDRTALKTLASVQGRVLTDCPELELIVTSGQLEDPAFMVFTAMRLHGQSRDHLVADVESGRFAAIALDEQLLRKNYRGVSFFWPRLRQVIEDHYVSVPSPGPPFLMVRKPEPTATSSR